MEMEASDNPALDSIQADPTLVATAFRKNRFYLFTRRDATDTKSVDTDRDVFNEKPSKEDIIAATEQGGNPPPPPPTHTHAHTHTLFFSLKYIIMWNCSASINFFSLCRFLLTLSHPYDGPSVIENHSPSRPDDGPFVIEKKGISKNHNELVSAK